METEDGTGYEGFDDASDGANESFESPGPDSAEDAPTGGPNPAWADLQAELGDIHFPRVQPYLEKFDRAAQDRITSLNAQSQKTAWVSEFQDQGLGPDDFRNLVEMRNAIQTDPRQFYADLTNMLRESGVLDPEAAAEQVADEAGVGEEELPPHIQRELEELRAGQDSLREGLEQRAYADAVQGETARLETELVDVRAANPDFDREDERRVIEHTIRIMQSNQERGVQRPVTYAEGAAAYRQELQRIQSRGAGRRPAPQTVPAGGDAIESQGFNPRTATSREMIDANADYFKNLGN